MEAWLAFPLRLLTVALIGYVVYFAFQRVPVPLADDTQIVSLRTVSPATDSAKRSPQVDPTIALPVAVGVRAFVIALAVSQSLAFRRFRRTRDQIRSLGGSIRFAPTHDSLWACFLFSSATVDLSNSEVDDNSLVDFVAIPRLKSLRLASTQIGNKTLFSIGKCRSLHGLDLSDTAVTDDGVRSLASLHNLCSLILNGTSLTDACREHLSSCTALKQLQCSSTAMTADARSL